MSKTINPTGGAATQRIGGRRAGQEEGRRREEESKSFPLALKSYKLNFNKLTVCALCAINEK